MGLMYSASEDTLISAGQLCDLPTPAPMGPRHNPVPFGDFLELVKHRLFGAGINIDHEEYAVTNDGMSFFGMMELGLDNFAYDGMTITLGLRGSHNQRVPRGLTLGNRVIVCSNLCFSGDLGTLQTKQTTNVWDRLPGLVDDAVSRIPVMAERETRRADGLKLLELPRAQGDACLVSLHRQGALAGNQLTRAIHEWDEPSYEEHAQDGFNAWRLLNAVTEAQKPTGTQVNMETVARRTSIATGFMDKLLDAAS